MEGQKVVLYAGLESYKKDTLTGLIARSWGGFTSEKKAKELIRECYERVIQSLRELRKRYRIVIVDAYKAFNDTALYIFYTDENREYHIYAFYLP